MPKCLVRIVLGQKCLVAEVSGSLIMTVSPYYHGINNTKQLIRVT